MKRTWQDIGSDVNWIDYGGLWARQVDALRWQVIRFENCKDWGDGATGYYVSLSEVTLDSPQLLEALESRDVSPDDSEEAKADALFSYGAKAPLWSEQGTNAHALVRAAKSQARQLRRDSALYERAMNTTVNRIGSTAREYQAGDISSAVLRGVADGNPEAELMLKLGM
jgi:hypothetical protein